MLINATIFVPDFEHIDSMVILQACDYTETCPMLKKGQCASMERFLPVACPHGKKTFLKGLPYNDPKLPQWLKKQKKAYSGYIDAVISNNRKFDDCGDYYYLPIPHLKSYKNPVPFIVNAYFCPKEDFTFENVKNIIERTPSPIDGEELYEYRNRHIPNFLRQLEIAMPEFHQNLMAAYPELVASQKAEHI